MSHTSISTRWPTIAACTVAMAASLGGTADASTERTLQRIDRYCQTSWRNAGIERQEWEDCTQQVVTDLLDSIPSCLPAAVNHRKTEEHRELKRAIWRTIKRWQRRAQYQPIDEQTVGQDIRTRSGPAGTPASWEDVATVAQRCLTDRQWEVLRLTRDGWRVGEIAQRLQMPASRVSDTKYRAIEKLKQVAKTQTESESGHRS